MNRLNFSRENKIYEIVFLFNNGSSIKSNRTSNLNKSVCITYLFLHDVFIHVKFVS